MFFFVCHSLAYFWSKWNNFSVNRYLYWALLCLKWTSFFPSANIMILLLLSNTDIGAFYLYNNPCYILPPVVCTGKSIWIFAGLEIKNVSICFDWLHDSCAQALVFFFWTAVIIFYIIVTVWHNSTEQNPQVAYSALSESQCCWKSLSCNWTCFSDNLSGMKHVQHEPCRSIPVLFLMVAWSNEWDSHRINEKPDS